MRSRESSGQIARALAYRKRFADRCQHFFANVVADTVVRPLKEQAPNGTTGLVAGQASVDLSIGELFLRLSQEEARSTDFLILLSGVHLPEEEAIGPTTLVYFVGPEELRRSTAFVPSGTIISDLWVAKLPWTGWRSLELSLLLYRIHRTRQTKRLLETLQVLNTAIDYSWDLPGSLSLTDSMLDRIQVLAQSQNAEPLFCAKQQVPGEAAAGHDSRYFLFWNPSSTPLRDFEYYARSGQLYGGPSFETATPFRLHEYLLLRLGAQIERKAPTRSIQQLRRERTLSAGAVRLDDGSGAPEADFMARETRLREVRRLTGIYGADGMQRVPAVTPIALEVAHNLIPLVESQGNKLGKQFQEQINMMRNGLRYELGVEVPGIRIRGNELDMPDGSYLIMIDEVPLVMGTLNEDLALCNATVGELSLIGVEGEPAVNPANGLDCAWVARDHWEKVRRDGNVLRAGGVHLWEVTEYMILHLSSVIRKNAAGFVGIRAAVELLKAASQKSYDRIRTVPGGLITFTEILRTLLDEEVPIKSIGGLCAKYLEMVEADIPFYRMIEETRCLDEIRPALRWEKDEVHFYGLGKKFVETIDGGIIRSGGAALLALEPTPTQEALSAIRTEISRLPSDAPNPFLLVEDWRLRRPIRKLVELEFPNLRVLARRELVDLADTAIHEMAVIEME